MGSRGRRSKPPSTPSGLPRRTFYLDESVGNNLVAQALLDHGQDVRRWTDLDAEGWSDVKWIHAVGPTGWISLTRLDEHRRR